MPQGSILGPLLFVIFANDVTDHVKSVKIIMYADDTVLYVDGPDLTSIENALSSDMSLLASWFTENELILNLKKGKTEAMVFGTSQKLATLSATLNVKYQDYSINVTNTYKYLGVILDQTLSLNEHFESSYKKASSRLFLLAKLRHQLTSRVARTIYHSMVLPVMTYCCLVSLHLTTTQKNKLASLDRRARKIINNDNEMTISILQLQERHACKFVRKCLDQTICDNFHGYFAKIENSRNTRNNRVSLKLPAVRTEFAKKSSYFMAAKIYNTLPMNVRKIENFNIFCKEILVFFTR